MTAQLLVSGTVTLDSLTIGKEPHTDLLGGSAVYASLAAAMFRPVALQGAIGEDFPENGWGPFANIAVDRANVPTLPGSTARWQGSRQDDPEEVTESAMQWGVLADARPTLDDDARNAPYAYIGNAPPTTQVHILNQLASARFVLVDTAGQWIDEQRDSIDELLRDVDAVTLNDVEALALTGERHVIPAALKLLEQGPWLVIVKRGEHGALLITKSDRILCPAFPLDMLTDATGAGDAFAGGFMGYVALVDDIGRPTLRKALRYATILSSFACGGIGTAGLTGLTRAQVERRLCEFEAML